MNDNIMHEKIDKIRATAKVVKGVVESQEKFFTRDEAKIAVNEYGMILDFCRRILDGLRHLPVDEHHLSDTCYEYEEADDWIDTVYGSIKSIKKAVSNYLMLEPSPWDGYHSLIMNWLKIAAYPMPTKKPVPDTYPETTDMFGVPWPKSGSKMGVYLRKLQAYETEQAKQTRPPSDYSEKEIAEIEKSLEEERKKVIAHKQKMRDMVKEQEDNARNKA